MPNEHHDHAKFSVYPIATRPGPALINYYSDSSLTRRIALRLPIEICALPEFRFFRSGPRPATPSIASQRRVVHGGQRLPPRRNPGGHRALVLARRSQVLGGRVDKAVQVRGDKGAVGASGCHPKEAATVKVRAVVYWETLFNLLHPI